MPVEEIGVVRHAAGPADGPSVAAQKAAGLNGDVIAGAPLLTFDGAVHAVRAILLDPAHHPRHVPGRVGTADRDGRKITRCVDKWAGLGVRVRAGEGEEYDRTERHREKTSESRHGLY